MIAYSIHPGSQLSMDDLHHFGNGYLKVLLRGFTVSLIGFLAIRWLPGVLAIRLCDNSDIVPHPRISRRRNLHFQSTETHSKRSLHAMLRSNQLLRYLEDHVFEDFLHNIEIITLRQGEQLSNLDQFGFCVVGSGEVEVRQSRSVVGIDELDQQLIFRRAREGDSLLPMASILEILLTSNGGIIAPLPSDDPPSPPHSGRLTGLFNFVACQDVELYTVKRSVISKWFSDEKQSSVHILEEMIHRVLCTTAPICINYLGLEKHWLSLMKSLSADFEKLNQVASTETQATISWLKGLVSEPSENRGGGPLPLRDQLVSLRSQSSGSCAQSTAKMLFPTSPEHSRILEKPASHQSLRRSMALRLQTSSFGQDRSEESLSYSPLFFAESYPYTAEKSLQFDRGGFKTGETRLRQSIVRHILSTLACLGSPDPTSQEMNLFKTPPPWSQEEQEHLVEQYMGSIQIQYVTHREVLAHQGQRYPGIYYIIDGTVTLRSASASTASKKGEMFYHNATISSNQLIGTECLFAESKSAFEVVAEPGTLVALFPREQINELRRHYPVLLYSFGQRLLARLPILLALADYAVNWREFSAGSCLHSDDKRESFSIVLHGRFLMEQLLSLDRRLLRHVPAGKTLGMPEMLVEGLASWDAMALRKSEIANIQVCTFESLALLEPQVGIRVARLVASNVASVERGGHGNHIADGDNVPSPKTVAVLTVSSSAPIELFTSELTKAIVDTGITDASSVATLDSHRISEALGGAVFDNAGNVKLQRYIDQVEEKVEVALLVGDMSPHSTWNRACITHADTILILAMADDAPSLSEMDQTLMQVGTRGQVHLVLIHEPPGGRVADSTGAWLEPRQWIDDKHHVLMTPSQSESASTQFNALNHPSADFHRLARRLFRRSIALVLGGGGARGAAHVGFLKAMEEQGIPVDIIGGSSMGACVGGVFSRDLKATTTSEHIRRFCSSMRIRHFLPDTTYPWLAKTTGAFFQKQLRAIFADKEFDDTWLEYYCAVTNVTKDCILQTVTKGSLSKFIAASMSYLGAVPPTCMDGDLIIDSCYSGNLPARRAKELGAEIVFVVDVSALEPIPPYSYGSTISGWKILAAKTMAFVLGKDSRSLNIPPSASDISNRLDQGTSLRESEAIKETKGCYYIKLPLSRFTAREFHRYDEIVDAGYQAGKSWFEEQKRLRVFSSLAIPDYIRKLSRP